MNIMSGLAVYTMIWIVVLFMILPIGVKVPDQIEVGHATSAPEKPYIWWKFLATSIISFVLWWGAFFLITSEVFKTL
jgi:predicted secreted protein